MPIDELAFRFFQEFARTEYCLKAVGLRYPTRDAQADWIAYADGLRELFETPHTPRLKAAIDYFLAHPPKKQVIQSGVLTWDPALPDHKHRADLILLLIRRVRNNLFHGGKFNGHWFDPERSRELMVHGLAILEACVQAHPVVREAYFQRAPET